MISAMWHSSLSSCFCRGGNCFWCHPLYLSRVRKRHTGLHNGKALMRAQTPTTSTPLEIVPFRGFSLPNVLRFGGKQCIRNAALSLLRRTPSSSRSARTYFPAIGAFSGLKKASSFRGTRNILEHFRSLFVEGCHRKS